MHSLIYDHIMRVPTPPELKFRPIEKADLPGVCLLHNHAESFDGVPRVFSLDELTEEYNNESVTPRTDTRLATIGNELVAYAFTYHLPSEEKEERCYIFGQVDPAWRRNGIGTSLMTWGIERATVQLRSTGRTLPRFIRTDTYETAESTTALFESLGMLPIRYNDNLLRPLTDLPARATVEGITIVAWPEDRNEEIRNEKNAAFADHWGSTPTSVESWHEDVHGSTSRPDLSFVAIDSNDKIVAHCLNNRYESDDELLGRKDGWIGSVGTLREFRGQGIASSLISHSLHAFAEAGLTHASLSVDSENPSGAAQLYRSLGFELDNRTITHQLVV